MSFFPFILQKKLTPIYTISYIDKPSAGFIHLHDFERIKWLYNWNWNLFCIKLYVMSFQCLSQRRENYRIRIGARKTEARGTRNRERMGGREPPCSPPHGNQHSQVLSKIDIAVLSYCQLWVEKKFVLEQKFRNFTGGYVIKSFCMHV